MAIARLIIIILQLSLLRLSSTQELSPNDFPSSFIFGAGSSAYQYEGAAAEDGRKPSTWDTFVHIKENTFDGRTGDVAVDQYHRYKEDVGIMSTMGIDGYKLSISWSRLIPDGNGPINPKGLQYYNNLINELVAHGIQPHVILHHFDLPQALEDAYEGFISPQIVEDFVAYADICFREFGDRVKYWATFNEPNVFALVGYDSGLFAPQRCSYPFGNCTDGNSTVEPYIVAHNVLLAHAAAVELYREKYQAKQKGLIGLALFISWVIPLTNKSTDVAATQRYNDFEVGWFLHPLVYGDYPVAMKKIVGSRLPSFTKAQVQKLQGALDFIGVNYYISLYCSDVPRKGASNLRDYNQDRSAGITVERDGIAIGNMGMQAVLEYIKHNYHNIPAIVYESGISENGNIPLPEALNDQYSRSAIRISRIVSETFRLGLHDVHWFVMGDDDTVFVTENLVRVLSKYDHRQMYYIGSLSESHLQNIFFSYSMAYGGGGFAISYPLAKALESMQDDCIQRYPGLYGSDDRIQACMAELGVSLTREPGFHQYDVYGNLFGLLSAHPVKPLVTLHHLDVVEPIFPNLTKVNALQHLFKPIKLDSAGILQQSICYDGNRKWSYSVSWGYAVQIFRGIFSPRELEMPSRTFLNWYRRADYTAYSFNTRPVTRHPCQKPFVFYMKDVRYANPARNNIISNYTRHEITPPKCRWKMASPETIDWIKVVKKPNSFLANQSPRRNCCRVISSRKRSIEIEVGQCKEGEIIGL